MIKLKSILLENQYDKANAHSWQTPSGKFYPIADTHDMDARKKFVGMRSKDAVLDAFKKGYNRIHHYSTTLYAHNEIYPLNDVQKNALIQLALHNDFDKLIFDAGEENYVIWSRNDVMETKTS